jgi:hypothetical protein
MKNINPDYLCDDDNIRMCMSCRRIKNFKISEWILDTILYTDVPDNVTYILCDECSSNIKDNQIL